jgi:hypothetical protein
MMDAWNSGMQTRKALVRESLQYSSIPIFHSSGGEIKSGKRTG